MTGMRMFPTGQINIGLPAPTGISLGSFRVKSDFYYDQTGTFNSAVTMNSDLILEGINVKDKLDTISSSAPSMVRNTVHMQPGSNPANWELLPDDLTTLVHDTNSTSRYRLPQTPVDGQLIHVMSCAASGTGTINLNTGSFSGRTFQPNSTGIASTIQVNLNSVGTNSWTIVYIDDTNEWLFV